MKLLHWTGSALVAVMLTVPVIETAEAATQTGKASYYRSGHRTASGERFDARGFTAAHPTLPFGTRVLVTNLSNGKSVIVRINDRGPHTKGRVIDLSLGAADVVGLTALGITQVKVVPLHKIEAAPAGQAGLSGAPAEQAQPGQSPSLE